MEAERVFSDDRLFDEVPLVAPHELPATASAWDRLSRIRGPAAERARRTLEEWWRAMPQSARAQIRERIRRDSRADHLGAFWEIYLHRLFTGLRFDVAVDIGNDTEEGNRQPDFRLTSGDTAIRVEATAVLGDDSVGRDERPRVQQLYDAIERARNRDFVLALYLREVGRGTPGAKLVSLVDAWLNTLDPDAERARLDAGGDRARTAIDHNGWRLDVAASPRTPERRGSADRIIGEKIEGWQMHRVEGERPIEFEGFRAFDDIEPIRRGLRAKAKHQYELAAEPFVVAVLCGGPFIDDRDIAQALLGRIVYGVGDGAGSWQGGGLWLDPRARPINTRIAAVLTVTELEPMSCAIAEPTLWTNPWAQTPVSADALPWRRLDIQSDGRVVEIDASERAARVLGLPQDWPADAV